MLLILVGLAIVSFIFSYLAIYLSSSKVEQKIFEDSLRPILYSVNNLEEYCVRVSEILNDIKKERQRGRYP